MNISFILSKVLPSVLGIYIIFQVFSMLYLQDKDISKRKIKLKAIKTKCVAILFATTVLVFNILEVNPTLKPISYMVFFLSVMLSLVLYLYSKFQLEKQNNESFLKN